VWFVRKKSREKGVYLISFLQGFLPPSLLIIFSRTNFKLVLVLSSRDPSNNNHTCLLFYHPAESEGAQNNLSVFRPCHAGRVKKNNETHLFFYPKKISTHFSGLTMQHTPWNEKWSKCFYSLQKKRPLKGTCSFPNSLLFYVQRLSKYKSNPLSFYITYFLSNLQFVGAGVSACSGRVDPKHAQFAICNNNFGDVAFPIWPNLKISFLFHLAPAPR